MMTATFACPCGVSFPADSAECPVCGVKRTDFTTSAPEANHRLSNVEFSTAVQTDGGVLLRKNDDPEVPADIDIRLQSTNRRLVFWFVGFGSAIALAVLCFAYLNFLCLRLTSGVQEDSALAQAMVLSKSCQAFRIKHGKYPDSLQQLLVKDVFGMIWIDDPHALIDPWGKPYQYDKNGPKNGGVEPDIGTVTPNGQEIGNWQRMKKR